MPNYGSPRPQFNAREASSGVQTFTPGSDMHRGSEGRLGPHLDRTEEDPLKDCGRMNTSAAAATTQFGSFSQSFVCSFNRLLSSLALLLPPLVFRVLSLPPLSLPPSLMIFGKALTISGSPAPSPPPSRDPRSSCMPPPPLIVATSADRPPPPMLALH